ncbi:MAG: hypothetical protein KBF89_01615 [Acidimicrobiia bacterium]|nr:hypothetical protein [Acidimicrobiia bacterium]
MKNFIHKQVFWVFFISSIVFVYFSLAVGGYIIYRTVNIKNKVSTKKFDTYFQDSKSRIDNSSKDKPISGFRDAEIDSQIEGTFKVVGSDLSPTPTDPDQIKAWKYYKAIAGDEFISKYMAKVDFYNDSTSDIDAGVGANETDPNKWDLSVNLAFISEKADLIYTMVHEYAHIFSLNPTQVNGRVTGSCPDLLISEGCALDQSYINLYYEKFWSSLNANPDSQNFGEYYPGREKDFVSEYGATNCIEDFAETFAYYTLRDTSNLKAIADEKITFMGNNDGIRLDVNRIRENISRLI